MLRLGVVGTNWITKQFIDAGKIAKSMELTAIYSRTNEKAVEFAKENDRNEAAIFTDLIEFMNSDSFDVVYIASPNSLHFKQVLAAIEADKDVIVEKPAFASPAEFKRIEAALDEHPNVFFFEGARHIYDPNFQVLKDEIKNLDRLEGATISYMKYSSRYDNVLAGEEPNVFSPKFAGGALQDLGVYTVYGAIALFGVPEKVHYFAQKIRTGVDGRGTAILEYPDFDVTLIFGKTVQSYIPTEIYGGHQTIWTDSIGTLDDVRFYEDYKSTDYRDLKVDHAENPLVEEVETFARVIEAQDFDFMQDQLVLAHNVNQVIYALRKDAKIDFANDGR